MKGRHVFMSVILVLALCAAPSLDADDTSDRWSLSLSSPETSLLSTPPCPTVMPALPSSLNVYLGNLTDLPISGSNLSFAISVDGHPAYVAAHPETAREVFDLAPRERQSIGVGFAALEFWDLRGERVTVGDITAILGRVKWAISATLLDGSLPPATGPVISNTVEFPLSRERCERGIACYR